MADYPLRNYIILGGKKHLSLLTANVHSDEKHLFQALKYKILYHNRYLTIAQFSGLLKIHYASFFV